MHAIVFCILSFMTPLFSWLSALLSNTPSHKRKLTPVQRALKDKSALDFLNISSTSKKAKSDVAPTLQETLKTKVQLATRKVK